jgi:MFS family permease
MSTDLQAPDLTTLRRARIAVAACFFLNGVLYANLVPRLPEVKDTLGLSNTALGAAIAALPLGALLAALAAAPLIRRIGSAKLATYGLVALAAALWAAGSAPTWWLLAGALMVAGALDAWVDVAQNAHGLRVQRHYGRSILNGLHGLWSIGAVVGGLLGSAAAGLGLPLSVHLAVSAVAFSLVAMGVLRLMLPGSDTADVAPEPEPEDGDVPRPRSARRSAVLLLAVLGVLAACGAFVEDAGSSWSAIYLRDGLAAGAVTAGLGFVALQTAMTVGRLTGDRVVDRFGQRRVARVGGALIAVGMGVALAVPSVPSTLAGFALAGFGVATLIPAVYAASDAVPGLPHGVGLAVSNWLLRIGFLVSPPLIGLIADASSLRVALLTVVLAGLGTLAFGGVLRTSVTAP